MLDCVFPDVVVLEPFLHQSHDISQIFRVCNTDLEARVESHCALEMRFEGIINEK